MKAVVLTTLFLAPLVSAQSQFVVVCVSRNFNYTQGRSLLFYRRRKARATPPTSGKAAEEGAGNALMRNADTLNVVSVLEKKYVVQHAYEPAAQDELKLQVGDSVKLDLLFNDGWAKGINETTGQTGLLPVACLKQESRSLQHGCYTFSPFRSSGTQIVVKNAASNSLKSPASAIALAIFNVSLITPSKNPPAA
ncbi:hypothetical protein HK104_001541 [Borealophlyctis nickersoniae]|nr:hypothetical protein HK104_001541 [Borealophlyctis nickersoniae]